MGQGGELHEPQAQALRVHNSLPGVLGVGSAAAAHFCGAATPRRRPGRQEPSQQRVSLLR